MRVAGGREEHALKTEDRRLPAGTRVLLAEDEPLIAIDGEAILLSLGVSVVVWVRTLPDGMNVLDTAQFHAALLDLCLGQDLSTPLAARLAALNVPFGFLTGFGGDAIPVEFKDAPVLTKPFTPEQLAGLLRSLVGEDPGRT